jgi:hypothetical protein
LVGGLENPWGRLEHTLGRFLLGAGVEGVGNDGADREGIKGDSSKFST